VATPVIAPEPSPLRTDRERAGRPPLLRELLLGVAVFAVYSAGAGADWPGRRAAAASHARAIFSWEQALHVDVEPWFNGLLSPHRVLRVLANYEYATTYVISAFALIFWIYARRPQLYRWARTSFVLLNLSAVACFVAFPVTPPRLMSDQGFTDTVRLGHTWGSWGSPLVEHANQHAAMPSLHFAWALWVSVFLAYISGGLRTQLLSAAHVLLTLVVILATANHYLLDAVAGVVFAWASVAVAKALEEHRPQDELVPAADVFFLHVESPTAPQHVGGVVLLDSTRRPGGAPTREDVVALLQSRLDRLPRFHQRLSTGSRWRRPRWVDTPDLDWEWHVPVEDLAAGEGPPGPRGGVLAFHALVARLAATPLPRDRPLWRVVLVDNLAPGRTGLVLIVHHVVADGVGMIAQALHLLEPPLPLPDRGAGRGPSWMRRALATSIGLAQLATDGPARGRLGARTTPRRRFAVVRIPLDEVRSVARDHGARVTDVLLCMVAGGLRSAREAGLGRQADTGVPELLRMAVPLMVREPGASAEGNVTAAVMVDVPMTAMPEHRRLAEIARRTARLHTGTRALASRFVMKAVGELLPAPAHAWFARTVYGRRFFHAIVSNMPGPPVQLHVVGAEIDSAYPLLPLAPGTPLAVGALGWNGELCVGMSLDPALVEDAERLAAGARSVFDQLRTTAALAHQAQV
jgi:diacylglycerol O-acyltransferase / wax synthase